MARFVTPSRIAQVMRLHEPDSSKTASTQAGGRSTLEKGDLGDRVVVSRAVFRPHRRRNWGAKNRRNACGARFLALILLSAGMQRLVATGLLGWLAFALPAAAERINQEGRILGSLPVLTNALLFNTSNADTVVSAMQLFPVTNPWNECISNRPVLVNSDAMIAQINSDVGSSHRRLELFQEMNYVLVPDNQPRQPIAFFNYPDESDLDGGTGSNGLYPIPTNLPIEEWPSQTGIQTLTQWQTNNDGSDRHAIMVAPGRWLLLGDVGDDAGGHELDGIQRRQVQFEHERAATGWLDFGGCGGFPDVPGVGSLRRMRTGDGGARLPAGGGAHAPSAHLSRHAQHVWLHGHQLSRDGPAAAPQGGF